MTSGQSDILDPLTPWAWALAIVTTIHIICVFFFWRAVIFREGTDLGNYFAWAILAIFPLEVGVAYFIQRRMKQQGHTSSGGWQVIVGSLILNPLAVGWWIAVSVLLSFVRAKGSTTG